MKFRRRITTDLSKDDPRYSIVKLAYPTSRLYEECSSSEMNTFCKDFQLAGFTRAIIVPRVRLAYDWATYNEIRRMYPFSETYKPAEDFQISFLPLAPTSQCLPMNKNGNRSPDGEGGEEIFVMDK